MKIVIHAGLSLAIVLLCGCATTIIPPNAPDQPVTVRLVDYGRHASLVLPARNGSIEYEYGEWKWFALGQNGSARIFPVLLWPTQGTLARRALRSAPDSAVIAAEREPQFVFTFQVSQERVEKLREQLARRYEAGLSSEVFNPEAQLTFVKDPEDYTVFHNCNHELAQWLRQLGCEIKGSAALAKFEVKNSGEENKEGGEN